MRLFNFFAMMFLLVGALAFSACTDTETVTETVPGDPVTVPGDPVTVPGDPVTVPGPTEYVCADGTTQESSDMCPEVYDEIGEGYEVGGDECYEDGDRHGMIQGTEMGDCIDGQGGNDSIKGMGGNDELNGGSGNDTLYGGPGDDELIGGPGTNVLDGGEDTDIVIYHSTKEGAVNPTQVWVRLKMGGGVAQYPATTGNPLDATTDSGRSQDTLRNIENVKGTHGNDEIDGDDMPNLLKGLDGADKINGHGGNDTILPNRPANADGTANVAEPAEDDGVDVVNGGEGSDTISYEGESGAVTVSLATVVAAVPDDADTQDVNEAVIAHVTAAVDGFSTDMITVMNAGTAEAPMLQSTIENVTGGTVGDTLTGDVRANVLIGGAGADTLNGEADPATTTMGGDDELNGGAGDDELNGGAGDDELNGGAGDDTLNGNAGADELNGGAGDDTLNGGAGNDTYIISKGDAGDTIAAFVAGDKIHLKGFTRTEFDGVLKNTANTLLQIPDPDNPATPVTIVTITAGGELIRVDMDVMFVE